MYSDNYHDFKIQFSPKENQNNNNNKKQQFWHRTFSFIQFPAPVVQGNESVLRIGSHLALESGCSGELDKGQVRFECFLVSSWNPLLLKCPSD